MLFRNALFDWGILPSKSYSIPVVSVGNIRVGGTGKTPMVEYLIRQLQDDYNIAVVSRGYGRSTTGCRTLDVQASAKLYGDEPVQIKRKFPDTVVVVSEKRVVGIDRALTENPQINLVILDDAFQHRAVRPYVNLMLTTWSDHFKTDFPFPAGRLREFRSAYKRADWIVVTKSPVEKAHLSEYEKRKVSGIDTIFSSVQYESIEATSIYGFSGLANNSLFKAHLSENYDLKGFCSYSDHHAYTVKELETLKAKAGDVQLVCTEKDLVKVRDVNPEINAVAVPIVMVLKNNLIHKIKEKLKEFES